MAAPAARTSGGSSLADRRSFFIACVLVFPRISLLLHKIATCYLETFAYIWPGGWSEAFQTDRRKRTVDS